MFRPTPLLRLSAVVLERDERLVLRRLGQMGAMHLIRSQAGPDTAPLAPHDRSAELARCDRFLARLEELCQSLEIPKPEPQAQVQVPQIIWDQAESGLKEWTERADGLLRRRKQLLERRGELAAVRVQISGYGGWEVPWDRLGRFSFLHLVIGSLPARNLPLLQKRAGRNVVLLPMPERTGRLPLIALTSRLRKPGLPSSFSS